MIGLIMGLGASKKVAQLVAFVAIPLLILVAFYFVLDAYGDSRYQAGKEKTDEIWINASEAFENEAVIAADKADQNAFIRVEDYNTKVLEEKEKLDEAQDNGTSPLDVLFGSADSVR